MSFEKYTQIYDGGADGIKLRVGKGAKEINFTLDKKADTAYRLFTVGETDTYYLWKDEPDCPYMYRMITDALDTRHAISDRYCLSLSCKRYEDYLKRVYKKIMWQPPILSYLAMDPLPEAWELSLTVTAKALKFRKDGFLRMRLDIRKKKDGVDDRSVTGAPDESIVIDIPDGTYTGTVLSKSITIPRDTANVGVFIEGKGYKGECYVERPRLAADEQNLLPSFTETTADKVHMDWTAQYLSRKEWPEFRVRLNGRVIFTGEIFERCHRYSEWEIKLPSELLREENTLSYELISDYHEPLPYTVYEAGIIEQPDAPLSLIAVSEAAAVGGKARVLVKTDRPNMRVWLICESDSISGSREILMREAGLHGLLIHCDLPAQNASFRLIYDGGEVCASIARIAVRADDRVITGTGDMVYICQDEDAMEEYLSWYLSNNIGDLVTIRPTYRWSGTRTLNEKVWRGFRRLMRELDMKYVLMADGRELPGVAAQPDEKMLAGKGFLGIQLHERDGAQFYWQKWTMNTPTEEQWANMMEFAYAEDPDHVSSTFNSANFLYPCDKAASFSDRRILLQDNKMNLYADRRVFDDYRDEHKKAVDSLSAVRGKRDTRHTGPAAGFKYMAEAGYTWLGAETMYQTMEPLMGLLRGVVKDRSMPTYGVHHAVQWSSTPHESPARYRRFRLALYASYMQGATDINTEEGLWRLEEYYDHHHRFGNACKNHIKQQQDFYRYVTTHTRSGKLYNPTALLHGRDDGVTFFGKNKTWGQPRPQTLAEDGWDLLKVIYPRSKPGSAVYRHPCPDDIPQGYHSGTPYGNIDILPTEARAAVFNDYRSLAFLGYNRFEAEDMKKLTAFVRRGGKLLLTDAHLTSTSTYTELKCGELVFGDNLALFCHGEPKFIKDTVNGCELEVCDNIKKPDEVLAYTDSGSPLICVYRKGKGEFVLFHTKEYPASSAIRELYEAQLKRIFGETLVKEKIWAEVGDDVEFSVYTQDDGSRHIYLLAVDWYRAPDFDRHAVLRLGDARYDVAVPFGTMLKCVCREDTAMWCDTEDGEVLSLSDTEAVVQGTGKVHFTLAKGGKLTDTCIDFTESGVVTVTF